MPNNQVVHCHECIFFNQFEEGKTHLGYCQIYAPKILESTGNKTGHFPIVEQNNFCGEGERKNGTGTVNLT